MKNLITILLIFFAIDNFAQKKEIQLTGMLELDSKTVQNVSDFEPESEVVSGHKSPFLAGLISALIPGGGEIYSGSYLKGAIFLAAEAVAISFNIVYNKKGDDQTNFYHDYAHQHWSVERYAAWTLNNATRINPDLTAGSPLFDIYDNQGNVVWSKLNALERAIGHYYSHQLEKFGHQQYYEMIGKYPQFNPGWDDFTEDPNDPFTYTDARKDPVTERFTYYSGQRGLANDFYNVASKAVVVMIVNHVASAVDAALTAKWFNNNLDINYEVQQMNYGLNNDYIQKLNLRIGF